eukprot:Gb_37912 [translate_table: standard]
MHFFNVTWFSLEKTGGNQFVRLPSRDTFHATRETLATFNSPYFPQRQKTAPARILSQQDFQTRVNSTALCGKKRRRRRKNNFTMSMSRLLMLRTAKLSLERSGAIIRQPLTTQTECFCQTNPSNNGDIRTKAILGWKREQKRWVVGEAGHNRYADDGEESVGGASPEEVTGAGRTNVAQRSDPIGEEMRVDTFVTDGVEDADAGSLTDALTEKTRQAVRSVSETALL